MKYKVGDRVRIVSKKDNSYWNPSGMMDKWLGKTVTIRVVRSGYYRLAEDGGEWCWYEDMIAGLALATYELHITCNDGVTTNAVYKENGKIVKRAKAVCAPSDEFSFGEGARLAFNRAVYGTDYCPSEVALKAEDKPTPKYKVGDKVRVVDNTCSHGYPVGEILTLDRQVVRLGHPAWYVEENYYYVREADIEPYTEDKPEFKVGDRVTASDNTSNYTNGVGTIECIDPDDSSQKYRVTFDKGGTLWCYTDSVKPYAEPKQEPVKLYCTKDYKPGEWVTKGKIYEVDVDGRIKFDDGYSTSFDGMPKPNSITDPLVPLVKREAQAGEWIYAVHKDESDHYEIGQIMQVSRRFYFDGGVCADGEKYQFYDGEYLVLDGYIPEPEYLNMKVVCVEAAGDFTVGKIYEFVDGKVKDNDGNPRPHPKDLAVKIRSLEEWNDVYSSAKFIKFKGEQS